MSASNYVHLDVAEIKKITDKAMLVDIEDEEVWIPLSQIADAENYQEGDTDCTVSVTEWFAGKEGLS